MLANPRVRGYIRFKENFMTGTALLAFDHFKEKFNEKYMIFTDGDIIVSSTSVLDQINLFEKIPRAGLIGQKKLTLGFSSLYRQDMGRYWDSVTLEISEDYDTVTNTGGMMLMTQKEDLDKYRNSIINRDVLISTEEPFTNTPQYRTPIWMDLDISHYFTEVLQKPAMIINKEKCYELTSEEYNVGGVSWHEPFAKFNMVPRSSYLKAKYPNNRIDYYAQRWIKYAKSWGFQDYCHNKWYPDHLSVNGSQSLKYDVII